MPIACPRCQSAALGKFCHRCGAELETGHIARRAMRNLFAPLGEYLEHARWLIHPRELVHEIRTGQFTGVELLGFWVAAVLIGTLIGVFLPVVKAEHAELPIISEAVQALAMMLLTILVFAPAHLLFRIGHREATIRQFVMTTLAIGALLYPWLALVHGLAQRFLPGQPSYWSSPFTILFYSTAFAALYRRRIRVTVAILIGYVAAGTIVLLALVAGIVLIARSAGYLPGQHSARVVAPG